MAGPTFTVIVESLVALTLTGTLYASLATSGYVNGVVFPSYAHVNVKLFGDKRIESFVVNGCPLPISSIKSPVTESYSVPSAAVNVADAFSKPRSGYTFAVSPLSVPAVIVVATKSMSSLTSSAILVVLESNPPTIVGGVVPSLTEALLGTDPLLM